MVCFSQFGHRNHVVKYHQVLTAHYFQQYHLFPQVLQPHLVLNDHILTKANLHLPGGLPAIATIKIRFAGKQ